VANLTLAIDDETLQRARIRAIQHGTSVNELVRIYLERFAGDASGSMGQIAKLSEVWAGSSGPEGRTWTRDDLHDRG